MTPTAPATVDYAADQDGESTSQPRADTGAPAWLGYPVTGKARGIVFMKSEVLSW